MQNRIKECIQRSGRMQKDVAEELGMTTVGLSQLVATRMPKFETFEKIARVLGIPVWKLILSDEELADIRRSVPVRTDTFRCPVCDSPLRVIRAYPRGDDE